MRKSRVKITKRPNCERCGKPMKSNGWGDNGKTRRWICKTSDGVVCATTRDPDGKLRTQRGARQNKDRKNTPKPVVFGRALGNVKRFLVTSAQNATKVHPEFLKTALAYCEANNAELVVIPTRYKNPTSVWTESQANEEVWADEVMPYLYNKRKKLCPNLILMGDIKTQPTAIHPLTGFESISHGESAIFGHAKRQLRCIPTPAHALPKILATTGSCTVPNYTDSRAGKKAEFHHILGALAIEISGKKFHQRQVTWDQKTSSFQDWDTRYYPNGDMVKEPIAALSLGDTHYRFMDPQVVEATFGDNGIISQLNPEWLIFHDLLDGYSRNPHHEGKGRNPFIEYAKRQVDFHLVEKEVRETIEFLDKIAQDRKCLVVPSNHDDFLRRWIVASDWRNDVDNAEFYLETALAMLRSTQMGTGGSEYQDPFTYWVEKLATSKNIKTLLMDESFMLGSIEHGFHGHRGPNGARGNIKNLSKLGSKVTIGHSHTPGIEGGAYQNGTSSYLRQEYTEGPGSWLHTHTMQYRDGKRSHVNIIEGECKL